MFYVYATTCFSFLLSTESEVRQPLHLLLSEYHTVFCTCYRFRAAGRNVVQFHGDPHPPRASDLICTDLLDGPMDSINVRCKEFCSISSCEFHGITYELKFPISIGWLHVTPSDKHFKFSTPSEAVEGRRRLYVQGEKWAIFSPHVFDVSSKFLPQFSKPKASMMRSLCTATCRQFDPAVMTTGNNCAIEVSHCGLKGMRHTPVFLRGFWSAALKGCCSNFHLLRVHGRVGSG